MPDYQCCHFCFWCSTKEGKKWCKYEIEEEQHEIKMIIVNVVVILKCFKQRRLL